MCNKKERKRDTGGGICFQFRPLGRCILLFMAGRGVCLFFPKRDGAVVFFSEAGRGGFFFSFDGAGRGRVFFFFEGRDGTVVFGGGNFFGGTGLNRYTVPPKAV